LHRGQHADLPVGNVPREDDHATPDSDRSVHVLEAPRLDSSAGLENADSLQMRILGGDPAEVVPHDRYEL
jgi:hypothetical protein